MTVRSRRYTGVWADNDPSFGTVDDVLKAIFGAPGGGGSLYACGGSHSGTGLILFWNGSTWADATPIGGSDVVFNDIHGFTETPSDDVGQAICGTFGFQDHGETTQYGKSVCSVPPVLQNQNPASESSGNSANTEVYLEIVDDNNDLDASTVQIYINGDVAWSGDSIQQPGYSGYKTQVENGYGYRISLWEPFDPGSQRIRVVASDSGLNSLDEAYSFETDAVPGVCIKTQWGDFQWGAEQWGACTDFVVTATAINEYTIRVNFGVPVQQVDPTGENDALNTSNYTISGGFRQLSVLQATTVSSSAVDLTVLEMTDGATYSLDILFSPVAPETPTFTGLGIHPRPVSVVNNTAGILEVYFSEQMLNDTSLSRPSSYTVTPQGDAAPVFVTGVTIDKTDLSKVVLSFTGGGSSYVLSIPGLMDPAGNYCSPYNILFEIGNPAVDELSLEQKLYLDTNLGAMALGISELSSRRIEDLAILRAKNTGHSQQFSLIAGELDRSGINRDDRKLKLFKG